MHSVERDNLFHFKHFETLGFFVGFYFLLLCISLPMLTKPNRRELWIRDKTHALRIFKKHQRRTRNRISVTGPGLGSGADGPVTNPSAEDEMNCKTSFLCAITESILKE